MYKNVKKEMKLPEVNKYKKYLYAGIALFVLIIAILISNYPGATVPTSLADEILKNKTPADCNPLILDDARNPEGEMWDIYYNDCVAPSYCLDENNPTQETCLPLSVFREVPELPEDFYSIRTLMYVNRLPGFCERLEEEYWSQPEFISTWRTTGIPAYVRTMHGAYAITGYGSFPSEYGIIVRPGDNVKACTYVHTAWATGAYQAMKLNPIHPKNIALRDTIFLDGTVVVSPENENNSKYFKLAVTGSDISGREDQFLFNKTWGYFGKDWIQKVILLIEVSPETPPGKYVVGFDPAPIDVELYNQWVWEYKTLLSAYGYGGVIIGFGRPLLLIGVDVIE